MCKNARAAATDFDIHTLAAKYLHEIERIASMKKLSKSLSIKSAAVLGHFGHGQNLLNGQTIKTKIVAEELQRQLGEDQVVCIDTHGKLKTLLRAPFQVISALKGSKNVLMFPAQNGLRVYAPLLAFFRTFFRGRSLHYVVIGGWLPQFLTAYRHSEVLRRNLCRDKHHEVSFGGERLSQHLSHAELQAAGCAF